MIDGPGQPLAGESSASEPGASEKRLRRLGIRSWRRGTREMDLILGGYADAALGGLDAAALDWYETLLDESDVDLYRWIAGAGDIPDRHREIIGRIRVHHRLG